MQLLLIEDNREIAAALTQVLAADYQVSFVETGAAALRRLQRHAYDIIILDLSLPDASGLEICETIRANGNNVPLLILTGETSIMSKIRLLDAGADDYVTKPFSLGELKARLRTLHRRHCQALAEPPQLSVGGLTLDRQKYRVMRDGVIIPLRRKEFALLECLMRHADTVVTRSALGNYAWQGADTPWTNTIDVHIKHLRDKVDKPFDQPLIRTVHGLGYKFDTAQTPVIQKVLQ
ncbi:MAG TPA: response regulator transcription factor [Candidatus Saccharimonadales bacterium]|nr:response regulator transcription factor [Candidatus Saccharimonadales bacterium]